MSAKNFNRKNLISLIYKNLGFSKNFSSHVLDDFIETIIKELIKSGKLKITSFGTFKILNKRERIGRNPKTKVEAKITSRKVVNFKASEIFLKKLNK